MSNPQHDAVPGTRRSPKIIVQTADVRVVEYTMQPGDSHPWHHHTQVSDRIYCLEGLIGVDVQTPFQKVVLRPGENCEVPPKAVHHVSNAGDDTGRYLLIQALGKYDYIRAD